MLKYQGVVIAVQDIAVARRFYEELLGQKVGMDFGVNVGFEGGLAIHQKDHFAELLGGAARFGMQARSHDGELYFETDEVQAVEQRLQAAQVEFIHPIREQPWGQRVLRVYDPDGHVVEIAETMEALVERMFRQGSSAEAICQKTAMPAAFVNKVEGIHEHNQ
jgi:catechol 2,3-dioxygenase-like lactoylglutathione lyase family enzyme